MAKATGPQRYVLLPPTGLRANPQTMSPEDRQLFVGAHEATGLAAMSLEGRELPIRVIDSLGPDGAKLVEVSAQTALTIRANNPGLRLVPLVYYTPAIARREVVEPITIAARAKAAGDITIQVVSKTGSKPIANAFVVAFVDFEQRRGAQAVTGPDGKATLAMGAESVKVQRLYVYPLDAHWSIIKKNVTIKTGTKVTLNPLDLGSPDCVRHFYGTSELDVGKGVTVGIVDTGTGPHPDLKIAGGANTVTGEDPNDFSDNGKAHGTHVAGIVAARGTAPNGIRGVAPGVTLRAYRVFGEGSGAADSFAIAKAIDRAVKDKCDLINMSLGGGMPDPTLKASIDAARAKGSLCIVAAGNDDRGPVSFPASEDLVVAVSALGRKGTFPTSAAAADEVQQPFGTDKKNFVARFSNVGPQIDLVGPGVAVVSTVPAGYAEISGTSMACPAVTGAVARAMTAPGVKIPTKRDAKRAAEIAKQAYLTAVEMGFGPIYEGHGLPQPK